MQSPFFQLVHTYDAFKASTSMVDTLQMSIAAMTDLQFTMWVSKFGGSGFPDPSLSLQNINSVTSDDSAAITDQSTIISDQFIGALTKKLSSPLRTIGDSDQLPKTYVLSMRGAFIGMFCAWYAIISNRVSTIKSATIYTAYFPLVAKDVIHSKAETLMDIIESNITFAPSQSPDVWMNMAHNVVGNAVHNTVLTDVYNQQIYIACLRPYLLFKYITGFIASAQPRADNMAPRDVRTRRYAILSVYMFIFHTVFAAYKYTAAINAFGSDTNSLISILDNVTNLFDAEKRAIDVNNKLVMINVEAESLIGISSQLGTASDEINLAFSNTGTVKQVDGSFSPQHTRSTYWKWFWYIALLMTVLCHSAFVSRGEKFFVHSVALSLGWIFALTIILIVRMHYPSS